VNEVAVARSNVEVLQQEQGENLMFRRVLFNLEIKTTKELE